MQFKTALSAALAVAVASAQNSTMNLTALISSQSQLSGLATLLKSESSVADMLANATNITILAPNNDALGSLGSLSQAGGGNNGLIEALLQYHVLPGMIYASNITTTPVFAHSSLNNTQYSNVTGGQVVGARMDSGGNVTFTSGLKQESNVTSANLNFTGGVVHIIDHILTIPLNVEETASAANLTALEGALAALNLTSTVDDLKDITIFAPSNDAFQAIGSAVGTLSTSALTQILKYHIINGTVAYSAALGNTSVPTLAGTNLTITVENGSVFVNSARVVNSDILVSGGVMHVIDAVLNPNNSKAAVNDTATSATAAFSGASSDSTGVPFTSGVPPATTTVSDLIVTTLEVVSGYTITAPAVGTATRATGGSGSGGSSSSSAGAAVVTGAVGAAALFGGAAFMANL